MSLPYLQDITDCFEIEKGFDREIFEEYQKRTEFSTLRLVKHHENRTLPVLRLTESMKDLEEVEKIALTWRQKFEHVVIFGTGGSSAGGQCVTALRLVNANPRLTFIDNVGVAPFTAFVEGINWEKTGFIVISKSGSTGETLAQFLIILEHLIAKNLTANAIAICENTNNPLRQIAAKYAMTCMDHDPLIGGRFSVLSVVGMLPAYLAGLDVAALRRGAHKVWKDLYDTRQLSQAAIGAVICLQSMREQYCPMQVFMPYIEQLRPMTLWYRQLWAESLGKEGHGQTPIDALGTVDQHSQLQLYLDGPRDKFFTLIVEDVFRQGLKVNVDLKGLSGLDYLQDKAMGDILAAHQKATAETLANSGRPVRQFKLKKLNEESLGALLMHFMLETMITADLMRIDAFDQPAVEQGKVLVKEFLRTNKNLKLDTGA